MHKSVKTHNGKNPSWAEQIDVCNCHRRDFDVRRVPTYRGTRKRNTGKQGKRIYAKTNRRETRIRQETSLLCGFVREERFAQAFLFLLAEVGKQNPSL